MKLAGCAARSVRDHDHPARRRRAPRSSSAGVGRRPPRSSPNSSAAARRVEAGRGAEQRLELRAGQRLGLGQEVEDPAAGVVDHHQPQARAASRGGGKAAEVVEQGQVAEHGPGPAPPPAARPGGGGDQAVDPVRAAVGDEAHALGPGPEERLQVAHRHARGGEDRVAVAQRRGRAPARRRARSALPAPRAGRRRPRAPRARPRASRRHRRSPPPRSRPGRRRASRSARPRTVAAGSARRIVPARRVGSRQSTVGIDHDLPQPSSAASHWRSGLLVGMSPTRRISSGLERRRAVAGDRGRRRRPPGERSWGPRRSWEVGSARIG